MSHCNFLNSLITIFNYRLESEQTYKNKIGGVHVTDVQMYRCYRCTIVKKCAMDSEVFSYGFLTQSKELPWHREDMDS